MVRGRREGVLIAGGGVSGCLAALALARFRPDVPLLIVEERERFGGDGYQCWFDAEVEGPKAALVAPLATQRWPGFYVAFPGFSRKLKAECAGFDGAALHDAMLATLAPNQMRLGVKVVAVRDDALVLDGGEELKAEGAIDARGLSHSSALDLQYEARLERTYRLAAPHNVDRPVLVDATGEQGRGFAFRQVVPLDAHHLMIADALVSEHGQPGEPARARLDHYVGLRGWADCEIESEVALVRPLPSGGDFAAFWRIGGARAARLGARGGFFHPVTGRKVADAARAALLLTRQRDFAGPALHDALEAEAQRLWRSRAFLRGLSAPAADGEAQRVRAERFFRLDPGLIGRFHADRLGLLDRRAVQKAFA